MVELRVERASGGAASVGRDADGRVVFVEGALPGERVRATIERSKKRFAHAVVAEVLEASAGRIEPVCSTARAGCGGCDLAHATREVQLDMKRQVVMDALVRIAGVDVVPTVATRSDPSPRYRTSVRLAVSPEGRAAYRRRRSHEPVVGHECVVAHPLVEEVFVEGRFTGASELFLRASASTGERIAVVDGPIDLVAVPHGVVVAAPDQAADYALTEAAAGREWSVSAASFFQSGPVAATLLVDAVREAVGPDGQGHLVDAYAGVGLFAGTVGTSFDAVTAIESAPSSVADARINLGDGATIVEARVERWSPEPADVVVADPARRGLGADAVDALAATGARRFVLVSCDPGSMGRDVGLLREHGYVPTTVTLVDAFADTSHVETVVGLAR